MSNKQTSTDLVPVDAPAAEKWETPEEAFTYLQNSMVENMVKFARFLWEVGQVTVWAKEDAKYGDGIAEQMAEMFGRKKTWVYECVKMHERYEWQTILDRFIAAGVPPASIQRLACIDDESARNYVEDRLVEGKIHYDDITKTRKEYEDQTNDEENLGIGPAEESGTASSPAGEEGEDNRCASIIKGYFEPLKTEMEEMTDKLDDKLFAAMDQLSGISDDQLYDLSVDRMVAAAMAAKKLATHLQNMVGSIALHRPSEFQEDSE